MYINLTMVSISPKNSDIVELFDNNYLVFLLLLNTTKNMPFPNVYTVHSFLPIKLPFSNVSKTHMLVNKFSSVSICYVIN
jgi:hypothetical protein